MQEPARQKNNHGKGPFRLKMIPSRPGIFWGVTRRRTANREGNLAALRHHAPVDVVGTRVAHRPGNLHKIGVWHLQELEVPFLQLLVLKLRSIANRHPVSQVKLWNSQDVYDVRSKPDYL